MNHTLDGLGRRYGFTFDRTTLEETAESIVEALHDDAPPALRAAVREYLGARGADLATLDDAAARELLARLAFDGEVDLREAPISMLRAPVMDRAPTQPEEPETPQTPPTTEQKYELIELVEVVDRGGEGTVGGAAGASGELAEHLARSDKKGGDFKQYVNLKKDAEGAAKRHPEYGRYVELKARIVWKSGDKTASLAGKTVKWKLTETKESTSTRPATFKVDAEKAGLGASDETWEKTSTTDAKGWAKMRVYLSQYGGDKYDVEATLDSSDGQAIVGAAKKAGTYIVWRKFWWQLTKRKGSAVPAPASAVSAFDDVATEMVAANTVEFEKADSPPAGSFYPKGMIELNDAAATDYSVIGGHNRAWFWGKLTNEVERPVKGHVIICEAQWDPAGASTVQTFLMAAKAQAVTFTFPKWNSGIVKPYLDGGDVVVSGKWRVMLHMQALYAHPLTAAGLPAKPAKMEGTIDDACISIPLPRTDRKMITVTLPADAPDPAAGYFVEVILKVNYGKYYAGESVGVNMLIKHNATSTEPWLSDTISHEVGHGFRQVPKKPNKYNSESLPAHAKMYNTADGHGGQGPHCSTGATHEAVTPDYSGGKFTDGTCIMFHQKTAACLHKFCATCEPHLRLEKMDKLV